MKILIRSYVFSLVHLTAGCTTTQFQPIQRSAGVQESSDSVAVRIFLLERDLPATFDPLGTVAIHIYGSVFGIHPKVEAELQKVGRQKGANGAYRIGHGTYDHDKDGIVSYLLFRYPSDERP
ncbi:hypothetical protein [Larkinella punicea]|uniref:Uncharacterized protein n=1 Tax=Larkinella punicea TaxID=2315727 RepID=A0A368JH52_9BACT|nr:hypothetical protein [Larkinella punicea]RCR66998.1 hypothetical protein DUE52_23340 [Larkinella punicea]